MPQRFAIPAFFGHPTDPANPKKVYYSQLQMSQPSGWIIVVSLDLQDTSPRPDPLDPANNVPWRTLVQNYQTPGPGLQTNIVLGYVDTASGSGVDVTTCALGSALPRTPNPNRTVSRITDYIDYWYQLVPNLDGIFFDQGPELDQLITPTGTTPTAIPPCIQALYSRLYQYVRAKPVRPGRPAVAGNVGGAVLLNTSQYEEDPGGDWIMAGPDQACDVAILWETEACKYFVTQSSAFGTNVWPDPPPSWWVNPSYAPDRIAHTIFACHNTYDMQQVVALSNHRGPSGTPVAGYVFVIDSNTSTYDHLPPYWTDELAAVATSPGVAPTLPVDRSVATSQFSVRDWTESATIYDTGQQPSTNPVFWATSDVWNRLSNAPGPFPDDQPQSEDPQVDPMGNNINYAFARIHRLFCAADTVQTVTASFLWADYGAGGMFQYVSAAPSVTVTFNPGDSDLITPGVQWSLPLGTTNHICLAVEISAPPQDPLPPGDVLNGQTTGSATNAIVVNDNNVAQRNLSVVRLPASPRPNPFSTYAIAHNADLFARSMLFVYETLGVWQEVLHEAFIEVIDAQGKQVRKPFKSGDSIALEGMQPGENRWIGLTAQVQGGSEDQILPVTFYEVAEHRIVNGFTIALQTVPLSAVIQANLQLHAWEFGRLAVAFGIDDAAGESKAALDLVHKGVLSVDEYMQFLRSHVPLVSRSIYEVGWLQKAGDPFGLHADLKHLVVAVESGAADALASTHGQLLRTFGAFLTMLQKEQGDVADILQTVRWQRELYQTLPRLKTVGGAPQLIKESEAFIRTYGAGQVHHDSYPSLITDLLPIFHETAEALKMVWSRDAVEKALEQSIKMMQQQRESPAKLQKVHRMYLLHLQVLGNKR